MPLPGIRAFTHRGGASLPRMWSLREISSVPKWGFNCEGPEPRSPPPPPRRPPFPASTMFIFEIVPKCKRTGQDLWASSLGPSSRNQVSLHPLLFLDSLARSLLPGGSSRRVYFTQTSCPCSIGTGGLYFLSTTRWVSQASQLQVSSFRLGCRGRTATPPASSPHAARLARSPDTPGAS